ncbi:hypothetical protein R1flu_006835 [Riccia fluitans]|uniref:Uncharacterized protein n=1 Tax=Riccia fluitans TaxID=41844 RepID=A0ABD1YX51_9MARC
MCTRLQCRGVRPGSVFSPTQGIVSSSASSSSASLSFRPGHHMSFDLVCLPQFSWGGVHQLCGQPIFRISMAAGHRNLPRQGKQFARFFAGKEASESLI